MSRKTPEFSPSERDTLASKLGGVGRSSLMSFIPQASKNYSEPRHLKPLLDRIELALSGAPQRVCCHAPPRHSKTESILHVPAYALLRDPALRFGYFTYGDRLSRSKSRRARGIAESMGVKLESTSLSEWRTAEGGGLLAGGVGGPLTGHGISVLFIDDPVKNRIEAESSTYRERLADWWRDVAATRIEPGGSVFVFMTRWHPDDLTGLLVGEGFDNIVLPAINDAGEALWPERWPLEALEARRKEVGDFTWASLFQGQPRSRGGRVFGDVSTYVSAPAESRQAFGLDLAYSGATSSDYSVAVRMARAGDRYFVLDVHRRQEQAPRFKAQCISLHQKHPAAPWRWYAAGVERGAGDFFREAPAIPLRVMAPKGDKFVRAISYAAAWNDGRVMLPERAPWLDAFLAEHAGFTGINDKHDDQVDAAVAAFDALEVAQTDIKTKPLGSRATGLASMEL